jgi:hypothetical protein
MIRIVIYNEMMDGVYTTCLFPGDLTDRSFEAICDFVRERCADFVPLVTPLAPVMGAQIRGRQNETIKEYFYAKYHRRNVEVREHRDLL